MYDCTPPTIDNDRIVISDKREVPVECYGKLDIVFHGQEDIKPTLVDVACVPGFGFDLCSLHGIQASEIIALSPSGVHLMGGRLTSASPFRVVPVGHQGYV